MTTLNTIIRLTIHKKYQKIFIFFLKKMPILLSDFDEKFLNNIDKIIQFIKNVGPLKFYIVSAENNEMLIEFFDKRDSDNFYHFFSQGEKKYGQYQNSRPIKLSYASVNKVLTGEMGEFNLTDSGRPMSPTRDRRSPTRDGMSPVRNGRSPPPVRNGMSPTRDGRATSPVRNGRSPPPLVRNGNMK